MKRYMTTVHAKNQTFIPNFAELPFLKTVVDSGIPRIFFRGVGHSTNSVQDRRQRERGSGGSSPLVRGSAQFSNE
jgi:hypothetical protein